MQLKENKKGSDGDKEYHSFSSIEPFSQMYLA